MANIRIVTENGETISYRDLCMSKDVTLRPHRGEYIHTKDGQKRYEILSVEWCKLTEDDMCGVLMILRETPIERGDTCRRNQKAYSFREDNRFCVSCTALLSPLQMQELRIEVRQISRTMPLVRSCRLL